jgi:hypothetical protein
MLTDATPTPIVIAFDGGPLSGRGRLRAVTDEEREINLERLRAREFEGFGLQVAASELFVSGGCHELATAIVSRLEDAQFVALHDTLDIDGSLLDEPFMVHAAAAVGDLVIDIDGIQCRDAWISQWSGLALEPVFADWPPGLLPCDYRSAVSRRFAEEAAAELIDLFAPEIAAAVERQRIDNCVAKSEFAA